MEEEKPISEIIFTLLYVFAIFALGEAISTSIDGFAGWGDLVAVILVLYQLAATVLGLPFLYRSLGRYGSFGWFKTLLPIILIVIIIEVTSLMVLFWVHGSGVWRLYALVISINLLPIVLYVSKVHFTGDNAS